MSRRSQVNQQRTALNQPGLLALSQARQEPTQVGIGQLVDLLMSKGAPRSFMLQTSAEPQVVRLVARCGPLELPLDFTPDEARKLSASILSAAEAVDPQAAEEEPPAMSGPEAEALLSEFIAAANSRSEYTTSTCTSCFREVVDAPIAEPAKSFDTETSTSDFDAILAAHQ